MYVVSPVMFFWSKCEYKKIVLASTAKKKNGTHIYHKKKITCTDDFSF